MWCWGHPWIKIVYYIIIFYIFFAQKMYKTTETYIEYKRFADFFTFIVKERISNSMIKTKNYCKNIFCPKNLYIKTKPTLSVSILQISSLWTIRLSTRKARCTRGLEPKFFLRSPKQFLMLKQNFVQL